MSIVEIVRGINIDKELSDVWCLGLGLGDKLSGRLWFVVEFRV